MQRRGGNQWVETTVFWPITNIHEKYGISLRVAGELAGFDATEVFKLDYF